MIHKEYVKGTVIDKWGVIYSQIVHEYWDENKPMMPFAVIYEYKRRLKYIECPSISRAEALEILKSIQLYT